jgi:hypothetical protein
MLTRGTLYTPTSTMSTEVVETRGLRVRRSQLSLNEISSAVGAALLQGMREALRRGGCLAEFEDRWYRERLQVA